MSAGWHTGGRGGHGGRAAGQLIPAAGYRVTEGGWPARQPLAGHTSTPPHPSTPSPIRTGTGCREGEGHPTQYNGGAGRSDIDRAHITGVCAKGQ